MRVLVFHGYLLRGTGSNIYNLSLARALAALGHEIELVCQERDPIELPDAVTIHNPDIGRILPVYVADEYAHFDAVPFGELTDEQLGHYLDANVAAVRAVVERTRPDAALANHLVMGPCILARALKGEVPYAVKVHGSALEYTVRPQPERFLPYAREGLAGASKVLVGSRHTAESLWEVVGDLRDRTQLGPPGVDVDAFKPGSQDLAELARRLATTASWGGEEGGAAAIEAIEDGDLVVSYVGKLIVSKGVDLLLAAWPLVVAAQPRARLVVVGFGTYRDALARFVGALRSRDFGELREIARLGRALEGGPEGELAYLAHFLDSVDRRRYLEAAPRAADRIAFTGRLEHEDLPLLLGACAAQVVPSTFPEAFGMVAAEAACCGALPLSASHSGLAEVTATLRAALAPAHRPLLSFEHGPQAVEEIARKLIAWLGTDAAERERAGAALSLLARRTFGWQAVAERVLAAARA